MNISNYRTFIRERKREVNKLTTGLSTDSIFETKVNSLLEGQITSLEFENYLENDLYLTINENYMINESLASKFADKVKSKIKSLFNNLYQKLKETNGFQMIISFFEKVVSGVSKFWKFLKKVKAGKLLKKLAITLGITSLASYILAQFGAGWVALMGGRMGASLIGKKVGNKVVKENLNYISLFEQFSNIKDLNNFLSKINVSTNKLNSNLIINFYKNVIDGKFQSKFDKWKDVLVNKLKHLKNATNSRNETRIKESLVMLKNHLKINDEGKSDIISDSNLKSYLGKSDGRKWGDLHAEILSILSGYDLIKADIGDKNTKQDVKKDDGSDKNVKKDSQKKDIKSDEPSSDKSDKEPGDKSGDKKESKKSIWSKIGGAISKFFKLFRKLKWAIVIFFGVVFILNLIFFPIFEPILQVAEVSSFSMILSDDFEETANAVSSIPKVNLDDVKINTDITGELPGDSEVNKTIQGAVNDVKGNIEGNEELAAEEADDIVQKSFNETRTGSINLSEMDDELFNKLPEKIEGDKSPNWNSAHTWIDLKARNAIGKAFADGGDYNASMSGSLDDLYQFNTYQVKQSDGSTVYQIIGIKRDSIGGDDLSEEKWNEVLGRKDVEPSQEVEQKGKFWKGLKDKAKNVFKKKTDIDVSGLSGDELVEQLGSQIKEIGESISESGYDNFPGNDPIELSIANSLKNGELSPEDLEKLKNINSNDFYTSSSPTKNLADKSLIEKLKNIGINNPDENLIFQKETEDGYQSFYLIPKELDENVLKELEKKVEKTSEIIKNNGFENSPSSYPIENNIYDLVKDRKLSPDDLEKIKNINTDDFYSSVSKIKQNGLISLKKELTERGIKPNSQYMVFKELENGNIQWFYLIPKK